MENLENNETYYNNIDILSYYSNFDIDINNDIDIENALFYGLIKA